MSFGMLPIAVFIGISGMVWALLSLLTPGDSRASERLDELKDPRRLGPDDGTRSGSMASLVQKAAPTLSRALQPKSDLETNELKVRLANAGFNSPHATTLYLATKTGMGLAGVVMGGGIGAYRNGLSYDALTWLAICAGCMFYLPSIVVTILRKTRMEKIFLSLPDALDLLVVCVEAGLGLDAAMRRVCDELEDGAPELCGELNMCNLQLQMGRSRREVLHDLGVRTGVDDVKALAAVLIQSERFGSSIGQALRVQSEGMRVKRSQLAEEKAQQTAVKMIFPLVLFIFPGIFVVLVGPAAIMMIRNLLTQ